jgi:inosine/xanthosine triphosphate pyrophosphatase family protein
MTPIDITYVTSSPFKAEENQIFCSQWTLANGAIVNHLFNFSLRKVAIAEVLEVSIEKMVHQEVKAAYSRLRVPCIVEHAGLIFSDYRDHDYPGGLTKPMWNTLGQAFINETHSAGRSAIARAVVGYCDGQSSYTFTGETQGTISSEPRGDRSFYWDTVFVPDDANPHQMTYAEIVADASMGIAHKVLRQSQSSRAMAAFLEWRLTHRPQLWQVSF